MNFSLIFLILRNNIKFQKKGAKAPTVFRSNYAHTFRHFVFIKPVDKSLQVSSKRFEPNVIGISDEVSAFFSFSLAFGGLMLFGLDKYIAG